MYSIVATAAAAAAAAVVHSICAISALSSNNFIFFAVSLILFSFFFFVRLFVLKGVFLEHFCHYHHYLYTEELLLFSASRFPTSSYIHISITAPRNMCVQM